MWVIAISFCFSSKLILYSFILLFMSFIHKKAAQILFSIVRDPEHNLQVLDISGNELIAEHFEQMRLSMAANSTLTSLDMRRNPGYEQGKYLLVFASILCSVLVVHLI